MRRYLFLLLALAFLLAATTVHAAWVDPTLEDYLNTAGGQDVINSYVVLKDRVNLPQLVARLDAEKANRSRRHFEIITTLQDQAAMTQEPLLAFLEQARRQGLVRSYRPFWIENAVAVKALPEFYDQLSLRPEVWRIYYDYKLELIAPVRVAESDMGGARGIEPGIELTRAPELWDLGIDGTGQIAGDMDTGCDGAHPAFASRWRGLTEPLNECWYDPAENNTFPIDYMGHGTHTMGTMVGDDGGDNQIGMAPGAKWIASAVIDVPGVDIFTEAVASFEWFADPDGNPATLDDVPAVINNSWGITPPPKCDDVFWASMDVAEAAGVAVMFAAGNEGPMKGSLRSPADRITTQFNAFSIGALKPNGTGIASFSSRGPSKCDWATIKPEVSARGVQVRSSMPDESYGEMDGTSMATPHVAGAIILLRQAYPEATVEQLKMALYFSAVDLGAEGEDNTYGMGRIDVMAAYQLMTHLCDKDLDGYDDPSCGGNDCNDMDPAINPDATEICDAKDNDCSGAPGADEVDEDGDGFMICQGDCNDADATIYPGAEELCDAKDNNCDESLGEGEVDQDGDAFMICQGDCNDNDATIYPGAPEICDNLDNNCDSFLGTDEVDHDGDGWSVCDGDCNDEDNFMYPGHPEICTDGKDNDCNGYIDQGDLACQEQPDDDTGNDDVTDDDIADDDATPDDDASPTADDDDDSGDNDSGGVCG